jgi:hypothetical protein
VNSQKGKGTKVKIFLPEAESVPEEEIGSEYINVINTVADGGISGRWNCTACKPSDRT